MIGYADVKSSPVYFYVQRNTSYSAMGSIMPFELTRLNIGGAMNTSSGIFTAPRNGIYSFHFSCTTHHPASLLGDVYVFISLILNGNNIGRSETRSNDDDSYYTQSLHSTLELKTGDEVWISIAAIDGGASLYDSSNHYTHFTGYFLQENVASSLKSASSLQQQ